MTGIIDVGGGNRAVFASGVFDYLIDNDIRLDYCIGVSAGSANCCSYVSGQSGRNLNFYTRYNFSPRAIGPVAKLLTGSLIDLDYIYGTLSRSGGKCPLDYEAFMASPTEMKAVATNAETGEAEYFGKEFMKKDSYGMICASSCMPGVCKPYEFNGKRYFDGYVSDPIPFEKALADGCDSVIAILTLPKNHFRSGKDDAAAAEKLKKYPAVAKKLARQAEIYNSQLKRCLELEKEGRALILYPRHNHLHSLEKDKKRILALYEEGRENGPLAADYLAGRSALRR